MGDGQPAPTRIIGEDFRLVRQLGFTPTRVGTFGIEIRVLDAAGCWGTSAGQIRNIVVR